MSIKAHAESIKRLSRVFVAFLLGLVACGSWLYFMGESAIEKPKAKGLILADVDSRQKVKYWELETQFQPVKEIYLNEDNVKAINECIPLKLDSQKINMNNISQKLKKKWQKNLQSTKVLWHNSHYITKEHKRERLRFVKDKGRWKIQRFSLDGQGFPVIKFESFESPSRAIEGLKNKYLSEDILLNVTESESRYDYLKSSILEVIRNKKIVYFSVGIKSKKSLECIRGDEKKWKCTCDQWR